jgi:hypothetical protein
MHCSLVQKACERTKVAIQAAKEAAAQKGKQKDQLQAELRQLEGSSSALFANTCQRASVSVSGSASRCQPHTLPRKLHFPLVPALSLHDYMRNRKRPA